MHKRLLLIALLMVGVALFGGCELLDQIIAEIPGSDTSGGDVIEISITYWLMASISQQLASGGPISTYVGGIGAGFQPDGGSYSEISKTFTASWDGGDYSDTYMEVRLNNSGDAVTFFWVRQTEEKCLRRVLGDTWTRSADTTSATRTGLQIAQYVRDCRHGVQRGHVRSSDL